VQNPETGIFKDCNRTAIVDSANFGSTLILVGESPEGKPKKRL